MSGFYRPIDGSKINVDAVIKTRRRCAQGDMRSGVAKYAMIAANVTDGATRCGWPALGSVKAVTEFKSGQAFIGASG